MHTLYNSNNDKKRTVKMGVCTDGLNVAHRTIIVLKHHAAAQYLSTHRTLLEFILLAFLLLPSLSRRKTSNVIRFKMRLN